MRKSNVLSTEKYLYPLYIFPPNSSDQLNDFSTNTDLLKKFGQKSIHLKQDKDLAKAVLKLFDTEKG